MLNIQVEGKRRRGGYHQEDVKHTSAGKEKKGEYTTKKMLNIQVEGKRRRRGYTKKMLNIQVQVKRRRGGYHQEDVKHTSGGREKKGRIPQRRC